MSWRLAVRHWLLAPRLIQRCRRRSILHVRGEEVKGEVRSGGGVRVRCSWRVRKRVCESRQLTVLYNIGKETREKDSTSPNLQRLNTESRKSNAERRKVSQIEEHTYGAAYKKTVLDMKIGKLSYSTAPILLKMKPTTKRAAPHGSNPVTLQLLYRLGRSLA